MVAIATIFRLTIYEEESSARFQLPTPPIPGAADRHGINHKAAPEDKLGDYISSSVPRSSILVAAGDVAVPFGTSARLCLTLTGWLCAGRAFLGP